MSAAEKFYCFLNLNVQNMLIKLLSFENTQGV